MPRTILFLGGNGHATARLGAARSALARLPNPFTLQELAYPGFEDRPRAADFEQFLDELVSAISNPAPTLIYATGIGGLIALCLRARGVDIDVPLLLQAPILWGLEHRWFPKFMRLGLAPLLRPLFKMTWFQRRFVRKHFLTPLDDATRTSFFDGYSRCPAMTDFFYWLTPTLLRDLERRFAERPVGCDNVRVWWGAQDTVVTLAELQATPPAIRESWPVREFPDWGHYPMIEAPDEWIEALDHELATIEPISQSGRPEAR